MGYVKICPSIYFKSLLSFQFPLWDTGMLKLLQELQMCFQFPLWDTGNFGVKRSESGDFLSIPFMGYLVLYSMIYTFV